MSQIQPIIQNDQLVLTTLQLAEAYGTDIQILVNNFNRNKDRYKEGKHFILLTGDYLREFRAKIKLIFRQTLTVCISGLKKVLDAREVT